MAQNNKPQFNRPRFNVDQKITELSVKHGISRGDIQKIFGEVSADRELGLYLIKQHTNMEIIKDMLESTITAGFQLNVLQDRLSAGKIEPEAFTQATIGYRELKNALKKHNTTTGHLCFKRKDQHFKVEHKKNTQASGGEPVQAEQKSAPEKVQATEQQTKKTPNTGVKKKDNATRNKGKETTEKPETNASEAQTADAVTA